VSTGIAGADEALCGGLLPGTATLVRGPPGTGKTIFGLHFLTAGANADETTLYVNLGEPATYLRETAAAFDLDVDGVEFLELSPTAAGFQESYDLFSSSEVEAPAVVEQLREETEGVSPDRVVIDPITEFRYLAPDERQFRTQVLGLLDLLKDEAATTLLTSQAAGSMPDDDLQFLVDAVVNLDGDHEHNRLRVSKLRGSDSLRGPHTFDIDEEGMHVWTRLDPNRYDRPATPERLSSGVEQLDALLNGGITRGTVTFLSGPTGVGKTTTGLQFLEAAAGRGQQSVLYSFEEGRETMLARADAIGIGAREMIDAGTLDLREFGPGELTVDEFTHDLRQEVDSGVELVMIDGASGFERLLRGLGEDPSQHLVEIARYLRNVGVTTLVTNEVHQITGEFRATERHTSHIADSIVVLRHVEYRGELRKVIGVLKMRTNDYENRLRELEITEQGVVVGEQLSGLRGILTGTPEWRDES